MNKKPVKQNNDIDPRDIEDEKRRFKKKFLVGELVIIICLVMIFGVMYPITKGEDKTRNIALIVFGSFAGVCIIGFMVYCLIEHYLKLKLLDPVYVAKKNKRAKEKKRK